MRPTRTSSLVCGRATQDRKRSSVQQEIGGFAPLDLVRGASSAGIAHAIHRVVHRQVEQDPRLHGVLRSQPRQFPRFSTRQDLAGIIGPDGKRSLRWLWRNSCASVGSPASL